MATNKQDAYFIFQNHIASFVHLSDADWELLAAHLTIRTLKKNGLFIQEGKKATEVGFVIDGMFRQYYTKDGEEKTTLVTSIFRKKDFNQLKNRA